MLPAQLGRLLHVAQVRAFSASALRQLSACIVGSGPAGFYCADKLLKHYGDSIRVDLLDRLPSPFGLVRTGVAPDHADTKNVINQFSRIASDPRTAFVGNVTVGRDVSVQELRQLYDVVVLAYGAESDRRLNIPGEDSRGVFAAREFVWWYNGHPDQQHLPVDLSAVESVALCGIGNVALDCARVLLRPVEQLAATDIAPHALEQLRASRVRTVQLCARRGPVQAACTPKELKELVTMPSIAVAAPPAQMAVSDADRAEMKAVRLKRRIYELIDGAAKAPKPGADRHLNFQFYRSPAAILADASGTVCGIRVERTRLVPDAAHARVVAVGTGEYDEYPVQLVLKSIGYKALPLPGVPFDAARGVVPNAGGRVLTGVDAPPSSTEPGLYVCGWLKRGPTGIIGTNLTDADETVAAIIADDGGSRSDEGSRPPASDAGAALQELLARRRVRTVSWAAWQALDAAEVAAGQQVGAPRIKHVSVEDMLSAAAAA